MSFAQVSADEAADLLSATDRKHVRLLLDVLQPASRNPLPPACLMQLLVFDWLNACGILQFADRQRIILHLRPALEKFVDLFDSEEAGPRTPASVALLDFRFVAARIGDSAFPFYDLDDDCCLDMLPHNVLTCISVDLNVLALRFRDRLKAAQQPRCQRCDNADNRTI